MAARRGQSTVVFQLTKAGPNRRPVVELSVVGAGDLGSVSGALAKNITRNGDILKRIGLKACPACVSGMDIWIRDRFEEVITARI